MHHERSSVPTLVLPKDSTTDAASSSVSASRQPPRRASVQLDRKPTPNPVTTGELLPTLHLKESDDTLELSAELPGVEPSDVHILLPSDSEVQLYLEKRDHESGDRPLGRFSKAFQLPFSGVKRDSIRTQCDSSGTFTVFIKKPFREEVASIVAPQLNS